MSIWDIVVVAYCCMHCASNFGGLAWLRMYLHVCVIISHIKKKYLLLYQGRKLTGQSRVIFFSRGWSIDTAEPFPLDANGNRYLFIAVNPFSKWVEARALPSLYRWHAAEFLYDDFIMRWGKLRFVHIDKGSKNAESFAKFCKDLALFTGKLHLGIVKLTVRLSI